MTGDAPERERKRPAPPPDHDTDPHPDEELDPPRPVYHPPAGRPVSGRLLGAAAAFAGALTLASFWFTADWYGDRATDPLLSDVADEAVARLADTATPALATGDLDTLLALVQAGNISPGTVAALSPDGARLLGGSRVELIRQPAVALRFQSEEPDAGAAYLVRPLPSQMARVPARATLGHPATVRVRGREVAVWRDGDWLVVRIP